MSGTAKKIAPLHARCTSSDGHHKCYKDASTTHVHECICDRTWEESKK